MPMLGRHHRDITITLGAEKLEWCGYPMAKKCANMFTRVDTIHECDGHVDGRTDTVIEY